MSKFVTTTYANPAKIELVPGSQCIAVTVDDDGISANGDGKKIVAAGTIVGGGVLTNPATQVKAANTPATTVLNSTNANSDILITNLTNKAVKIALVDPSANSASLKLDLTTDTIKVMLATSGAGAITSTAAEVIALINANPAINQVVVAANYSTQTGAGVVEALAAATIDGSAAVYPEGVLLHDVDVTHGPKSGPMMVFGIVDTGKLTTQPSDYAKKALAGRIVFAA